MKQIANLLIELLLSVVMLTSCAVESPTAREVADGMNIGINLGNTLEGHYTDGTDTFEWVYKIGKNTPADYENSWGGGHPTELTIKGMKECGFDTVRIPVYWGNMMENDGTFTIHPDYIARVKEIADWALDEDMYVVINIHHFDDFVVKRYENEECAEIFYRVWYQIADYFKNAPYNLVFEGYNEAMGTNMASRERTLEESYELANMSNQAFVDAVRATGGRNKDRVLIASGYWTSVDHTTDPMFVMPTDTVEDRMMVSVHYIDNNMYWSSNVGNQRWIDHIEEQSEKLDAAFTSKGIPVFLGETSCIYHDDRLASDNRIIETSPECLDYILRRIYDRGYVAVLWTQDSSYYNRETGEMEEKEHGEVILKLAEELR